MNNDKLTTLVGVVAAVAELIAHGNQVEGLIIAACFVSLGYLSNKKER